MPRAYVFLERLQWICQKNHPRSHPGNAQKHWENKPFRATAPISKKNHLTKSYNSRKTFKTLGEMNDFTSMAGDDPGTSKTNLGP